MKPAARRRGATNWSLRQRPSITRASPVAAEAPHRPAATARRTARSRWLRVAGVVVCIVDHLLDTCPMPERLRPARTAGHPAGATPGWGRAYDGGGGRPPSIAHGATRVEGGGSGAAGDRRGRARLRRMPAHGVPGRPAGVDTRGMTLAPHAR